MNLPIAERLAGEPDSSGRRAIPLLVVARCVVFLPLCLLSLLLLWPLHGVCSLLLPPAPNIPPLRQFPRYLRYALTEPGVPLLQRAHVVGTLLGRLATRPVSALCWHLDDVLYGAALRTVVVTAPIFEVSAGRSGSSLLALAIESDARFVAPPFLFGVLPYVWMWRLATATVGRFIPQVAVMRRVRARLARSSPEFLLRHTEIDLFRTDTIDLCFSTAFLNFHCIALGPRVIRRELTARGLAPPHDQALYDADIVEFIAAVGAKTLFLFGGPASPRRLFIKGHFLASAPVLERRFPDCTFVTSLRLPAPRIQSKLNFMRAIPYPEGAPPWSWLVDAVVPLEMEYCEQEMRFYRDAPGPGRRVVVRFDELTGADPTRALRAVFEALAPGAIGLDEQVSNSLAAVARGQVGARKAYRVNRTLSQLGISESALNGRLEAYIGWCQESERMGSAGIGLERA